MSNNPLEEDFCRDIKGKVIDRINESDCVELLLMAEKILHMDHSTFILQPAMHYPESTLAQQRQVQRARNHFSRFPETFPVENLEPVIAKYRSSKAYLYIYFLCSREGRIHLAFLFKDDFYRGSDFKVEKGEDLYMLSGRQLVPVLPDGYRETEESVARFETFFNTHYADFQFTKYMVYSMNLIRNNFSSFGQNCAYLSAGIPYGTTYRPNLIFKIETGAVIIPADEPDDEGYRYFNMGHLYP